MMSTKSDRYWRNIVMFVLPLFFVPLQGQNYIQNKLAFVTNNEQSHNFIFIPNYGKYYQFKIYRKTDGETDYQLLETVTRPISPNSNKLTTCYSIEWTDQNSHSNNYSYKIEACNKNGSKICDMNLIWQCAK